MARAKSALYNIPYHVLIGIKSLFDSTKGYPGEGPVTAVGYNVQGLRSEGRILSLIRAAARKNVDLLFIQEHNLTKAKKATVDRICNTWGYMPYVGYNMNYGSGKGGAALFVRKECAHIDLKNANAHYLMRGAIAGVTLDMLGERVKLLSVYVPAEPRLRGAFIREVQSKKLITRGCIAQGDWNCVPNVAIDVASQDGTANANYHNTHGNTIETLLARAGLADVFRLYAGQERQFTRTESTVHTRLDRFYAPKYNSHWHFTKVATQPLFLNLDWIPDHHPVLAEIQVPNERAPTPFEMRLDPRMYEKPEIQKEVRATFTQVYESMKDYSRADAWDEAKAAVTSLLKELNNRARREQTNPKKILQAMYQDLITNNTDGPTPEFNRMKTKLKTDIKNATDTRPPRGWLAYLLAMREEMSSKVFYRAFKAKHANHDICALHETPDWFHPGTKTGTTNTNEGIAQELEKYYRWLFRSKPMRAAKACLDKLRSNPIPHKVSEAIEALITKEEVIAALRTMAKGKAPGPDMLTAEFYLEFEDLIIDPLVAAINEAHERHSMPRSWLMGIIKVIYKKGDPAEVRNYRPLTMLNTDYKILTKVLTYRVKKVLDHFVSKCQLGFVPRRVITEASHLVKLVQAYLDETDETGLLIALDWEKAFDSVSWDYMHESFEAAGLGPYMRRWLNILYNKYDPPQRTVQTNGIRSEYFDILSGIPQGDPLSPVAFLFVVEALSRLILEDEKYHGIDIGGYIIRLTQFADDTLLFLRGYAALKRAWQLITIFSHATAMNINVIKTEGIRVGRLQRYPVPVIPELLTHLIKWARPNSFIKLLGIPFWETQYTAVTQVIASTSYSSRRSLQERSEQNGMLEPAYLPLAT